MAVLSSLSYARLRVRQAKTGQRVRLGAVVTGSVGGVFNLAHETGSYARTSQRLSSPYFAWTPPWGTPPFEHDTAVAGSAGCTEARFAWINYPNAVSLICNDSGNIKERLSTDDGYTWSSPEVIRFASASHGDVLALKSGGLIQLAYRAGTIVGIRQLPAGAAPSAEFTLKDSAGSDLLVEDDSFRLVEDARGWLWLHCRLAGGSETALLYSNDLGTGPTQGFTLTSGAVTGIASGAHPGLAAAPSGTLYAFARVGTEGRISFRHLGSEDWSTPVAMVDDAAAALSFVDTPFSIAGAHESSDRLILAAVLTGESIASEWYSASPEGDTWKQFPAV